MTEIQAVIFDVDGTLVDSNDAHAYAWVEALAESGYSTPFEQIRRLIGMGADNLLPEVTGLEKESDQGTQISKRRGEIFKEHYLPQICPFPQTRTLLNQMRERGLRVVVASSAEEAELNPLLEIAEVSDLVEERTSSSDAKNSKPDPDIVQAALETLGLDADHVVMIGDTPYDLEAATKAGVRLVGFRCGGWNDSDFAGAMAMYADPADLLARYEESPFVQRASRAS